MLRSRRNQKELSKWDGDKNQEYKKECWLDYIEHYKLLGQHRLVFGFRLPFII